MGLTDTNDRSIFVSIACIGKDTELKRTIESCFSNAFNPERVHIGVNLVYSPIISNDPEYIFDFIDMLNNYKNVTYVISPVKYPPSVTRDRNAAADLYENQDYILQTDSHCYFMPAWDQELIEAFELAVVHVNNERTVLTATLPKYTVEEFGLNDLVVPERTPFGFGFWENDFLEIGKYENRRVPSWAHSFPEFISPKLHKTLIATKFAPAPKITGAFMFGNKNLAKHIKAPDWIIFWEEEIVLSIELIDNGFTLVFPYIFASLYHFYEVDVTNTGRGERASIGDIIVASSVDNESIAVSRENRKKLAAAAQWIADVDDEHIEKLAHEWRASVNRSLNEYITKPSHHDKVRAFEKYSGVSFKNAVSKTEFPPYYCNIGKHPAKEEQNVG